MSENIREIGLDALLEIEKRGTYSHRVVAGVLDKYSYLPARDRAFLKRLLEGTLEREPELDYMIDTYSSIRSSRMKPLIRCLLRMSAYQILYMDGIPDTAVCNEAVKLAAKRKFVSLKGFVNGVLRTISRNKENLSYPDKQEEMGSFLSVRYSMPLWIVDMWRKRYGDRVTEKLLQALLEVRPVSLRLRKGEDGEKEKAYENRLREHVGTAEQSPYLPYIWEVRGIDTVTGLPGYEEGAFMVQDVSSALAVEAAGIGPGDLVVDACAAPGGKAVLAAQTAERVIARDVTESKVERIRENAARMQVHNLEAEVYDARKPDRSLEGRVDVLLLDVPCSGLGIMGKKRDIKRNASPDRIGQLAELQKEILTACQSLVKPGGVLLYSTCTINEAENEDMCAWIEENLPFEGESLRGYVPERLWREREELLKESGRELPEHCMQLLPGYMRADGFFFARFRRK